MSKALNVLSRLACLLLAAFFAFVGYWKAFGSIEALAAHHAWVAGWPAWFARAVGLSELACAVAMVASAAIGSQRLAGWTALVLIANQLVALAVHAWRGEAGSAGPQNLVLIALLALVAFHALRRSASVAN